MRTDRIGDVILSTPVIINLRKRYPNAYIAFMCRPYTKEILEGNPYLNEIIVYDKKGAHRSFWGSLRFALALRRKKFDIAIILHPTNRVNIITFFAGIPLRIGWRRKFGFLLNKPVISIKEKGMKHERDYNLYLLEKLGIPIVDRRTYFPLDKEDKKHIEKMLRKRGVESTDKIVVIHPSASCVSKRWPEEYFCELTDYLITKLSCKVCVVTSKEESKYANRVVAFNPSVIDLRGKLSLKELGALINKSALFISNDSGPVHIAAALNKPVISIFGRNDPGLSPTRWRPLGINSFYLHKPTNCSPCLAHNCDRGFICLRSITPGEVITLAEKIIKEYKKE